MRYGALILAAGASSRLGVPKQLVRLHGETLLDRSIRIAQEAGCAPIVVVLGAFENEIRQQCNLKDVHIVSNPDWTEGMGSSLSCGVSALSKVPGTIVMTCDMPAVTVQHLRSLTTSGSVTSSSYGGRAGVPAFFESELFPALLAIKGDEGARHLLRSAPSVELPNGELDIDTREDLSRTQAIYEETPASKTN